MCERSAKFEEVPPAACRCPSQDFATLARQCPPLIMSSSLANAVSKYAGSKTARAALNTNFLRAMVERGDVFKLPDLQYGYSELEPFISAEIMELHHSKHHQAYINNLKVGMEKYLDAEAKGDKEAMAAAESAIAFNGGGHENHSIFWKNLAPPKKGGGEPPAGALADAIASEFGSFEVRAPTACCVRTCACVVGWGASGVRWRAHCCFLVSCLWLQCSALTAGRRRTLPLARRISRSGSTP